MKKAFLGLLIGTIISSYSQAATLIQDLSGCDSTFFKKALQNNEMSTAINDFYKSGLSENGYEKSIVLSDSGIKLNRFTVQYTNFDKYGANIPGFPTGQYYFWGFETKQPIKQVVEALSKQINLVKASNNSYIYNPEYRNSSKDAWQKNKSALAGVILDKNSAEKLFILESTEDGGTSIFCTIQGMIVDKDLHRAGLVKQ